MTAHPLDLPPANDAEIAARRTLLRLQLQNASQHLMVTCATCDVYAESWRLYRCLECGVFLCPTCAKRHFASAPANRLAQHRVDSAPGGRGVLDGGQWEDRAKEAEAKLAEAEERAEAIRQYASDDRKLAETYKRERDARYALSPARYAELVAADKRAAALAIHLTFAADLLEWMDANPLGAGAKLRPYSFQTQALVEGARTVLAGNAAPTGEDPMDWVDRVGGRRATDAEIAEIVATPPAAPVVTIPQELIDEARALLTHSTGGQRTFDFLERVAALAAGSA